jgi:cytochrome c5
MRIFMRIFYTTLLTLSVIMPAAFAADDGAAIFENECASCHSGGFAGWWREAPNVYDPEVWTPLAAKGSEALTFATINGVGEMSPRGRCENCTDEQIKAAVDYMIEQAPPSTD